jgi:hypothetical protein
MLCSVYSTGGRCTVRRALPRVEADKAAKKGAGEDLEPGGRRVTSATAGTTLE